MKLNPIAANVSPQMDLTKNQKTMPELDDKTESRELSLLKKSKELESVFLTQMIKSMEKTIPEGMGGSKNSLSSMMFSSVMGDAMSEGGGIGLSKMIYASLKNRIDGEPVPEMGGEDYLETINLIQNIGFSQDMK